MSRISVPETVMSFPDVGISRLYPLYELIVTDPQEKWAQHHIVISGIYDDYGELGISLMDINELDSNSPDYIVLMFDSNPTPRELEEISCDSDDVLNVSLGVAPGYYGHELGRNYMIAFKETEGEGLSEWCDFLESLY